jgi:hypothetical protein
MNPVPLVFLYSPLPCWGALVLFLYRHDLSRLRHPWRDDWSLRNWWSVLNRLGLIDEGQSPRKPSGKRAMLPYAMCSSVAILVSLSWALGSFPLVWYYLVIVQGVSGMVLAGVTAWYLGPVQEGHMSTRFGIRGPVGGSGI